MAQPDPSLGISADFDNDGFRNAIRFAMQMGTPPDPDRRPKFLKDSTDPLTYWRLIGSTYTQITGGQLATLRLDSSGQPLDPDVQVRAAEDVEVEVDCVVEIERADAEEGPVGLFPKTRLVVTLLDEQYAEVEGCNELIYNGDRYVYGYEPETNGLFDVGVYTMIFYPRDES